jgi:DNA (cytosine-5)-methyltransferase 1
MVFKQIEIKESLTINATLPAPKDSQRTDFGLRAHSLFTGIGGFELGFERAGGTVHMQSEVDPSALSVLASEFPNIQQAGDVTMLTSLPPTDVLFAGFPCQDLSQVGRTQGIHGSESSLVTHLFRLINNSAPKPAWVVIENVPFMLYLNKGSGIKFVLENLEELGYEWAFRIVDANAFGLPQRRRRLVIVASYKSGAAKDVLLADDTKIITGDQREARMAGFYWTEGLRGLGWAENSTPPIKGGSSIGIPAPPAIWDRNSGLIGTPTIEDTERLQGFPAKWTASANNERKRWRLIGNAVPVPLSEWISRNLISEKSYDGSKDEMFSGTGSWPKAAWGGNGKINVSSVSERPVDVPSLPLNEFLSRPLVPLSLRASSGFYKRAQQSSLHFKAGFLEAVEAHIGTFG